MRESVDLMELNHFYDEHGRLVFDQIIFYDWQKYTVTDAMVEAKIVSEGTEAGSTGYRFQVRAWRLIKNPCQIPHRDWRQGGYSACWQDGEIFRHVISKSIRETWTQYDPELVEREYLPKEKRRELRTPKVKKVAKAASVAPVDHTETNNEVCPMPGP